MTFPENILIKVAIFVLGLCGFMVARHIYKHKKINKPLVCPIKFDCHAVVHSDYSKFIGLPLEFLGMTYYAFISIVYLFLIFFRGVIPSASIYFLVLISLTAFLFSVYLRASFCELRHRRTNNQSHLS